jgi:hypothetical protein
MLDQPRLTAFRLLQLPVGLRGRQHRRAELGAQLALDPRDRLRQRHVLRGVAARFLPRERKLTLAAQQHQLGGDALHERLGLVR